jgi:hypothetical protein
MKETAGIRNSVRGVSWAAMPRRTDRSWRRRMGPRIKPMKRSMPVHKRLVNTCTKFRNQRFRLAMAATSTAKPAATYHM